MCKLLSVSYEKITALLNGNEEQTNGSGRLLGQQNPIELTKELCRSPQVVGSARSG